MKKNIINKFTYDPEVDAAYLYLMKKEDTNIVDTVVCELPEIVKGDINIDINEDCTIAGLEILSASKVIPEIINNLDKNDYS